MVGRGGSSSLAGASPSASDAVITHTHPSDMGVHQQPSGCRLAGKGKRGTMANFTHPPTCSGGATTSKRLAEPGSTESHTFT